MKNFSEELQGCIYAILAFTFWGLVPIYFKLLSSVDPAEVLVHRIIWSVVLLFGVILMTRQLKALWHVAKNIKTLILLSLSSFLVATNWLVFIWAVSNGKITEASLGYYINPLISVALGVFFYKDALSIGQKIAIFLGFLAIAYQIVILQTVPIVSLVLAFSFALYAFVRKKANLPSLLGLYIETVILLPLACAYFFYLLMHGANAFKLPLDGVSYLLLLAGIVTVIPLLWFNAAATKISLTYIGFFQYIGPTVSFLLAVLVYNEPFGKEKFVTFGLIWLALFIFSMDTFYQKKSALFTQSNIK